jgi:hypothetical protein
MSATQPTAAEFDRVCALIAVGRWTYAKTMPEAPHEYCLRMASTCSRKFVQATGESRPAPGRSPGPRLSLSSAGRPPGTLQATPDARKETPCRVSLIGPSNATALSPVRD